MPTLAEIIKANTPVNAPSSPYTPFISPLAPKTNPASLVGTMSESDRLFAQGNAMLADIKKNGIQPAVQTSATATGITNNNLQDLSGATAPRVAKGTTNADGALIDPTTGQLIITKTPAGTEVDSLGNVITPAQVLNKPVVGRATSGETGVATPPVETPESKLAKQNLANTQAQLDTLSANADARTSSIISNIQAEYASLMAQQEQANQAYLGGVTTEGIVSGRARYAGTIQSGILSSVISQGIGKIQGLQNKKNQLILEAESARDERNFKALNEKMTQYRATVKEEREAAQKTYENVIKSSEEARAKAEEGRKATKETVDNSSATIAQALAGVTDEATRNAYITSYAQQLGVDPVALRTGVIDFNNKQNEKIVGTIQTLAGKYADAGITTEDFRNADLTTVMTKIEGSPSYKLGNAKEKAEINKLFYDAEKARTAIQPGGDRSEYLSIREHLKNNNGVWPKGSAVKEGSILGNMIFKDAMADTGTIARGTIVNKHTGFMLESSDIPAALNNKLGTSIEIFDAVEQMRDFLSKHTTYPTQAIALAGGKLATLNDTDYEYFVKLRGFITANYVNSISGAGVTDSEFKRLSALIPNTGEWNKYNIASLDAFDNVTRSKAQSGLGLNNATLKGIDLKTNQDYKKEAEPFKSQLQSGEMIVRDKYGTLSKIPESEFDPKIDIKIY